jgi:hypothetical protein
MLATIAIQWRVRIGSSSKDRESKVVLPAVARPGDPAHDGGHSGHIGYTGWQAVTIMPMLRKIPARQTSEICRSAVVP